MVNMKGFSQLWYFSINVRHIYIYDMLIYMIVIYNHYIHSIDTHIHGFHILKFAYLLTIICNPKINALVLYSHSDMQRIAKNLSH